MRPLLLLTLIAAIPCAAQQASPTSPLGIFATHTGVWEGESWTIRGPQGKVITRQRETVGHEAGGHVLTVHGLGTMLRAGKTDTIHHAFAIMHLSQDGTRLHMRAFTAEGRWLDPEITATPRGYNWQMTDPRVGPIKYEMRIDEQGRWIEDGYMSRDDGKTWMHFLGMVLVKQ
ncbi:MAG: hypothetical protein SFU84_13870 [Gemmatimonadales bacterium]|nr:hypothetical protein [Gemmatimonadales bacterium]